MVKSPPGTVGPPATVIVTGPFGKVSSTFHRMVKSDPAVTFSYFAGLEMASKACDAPWPRLGAAHSAMAAWNMVLKRMAMASTGPF